jgi:hypothetical protein
MTLVETTNRFLDKYHTKKRWPYVVLFVVWFIFTACMSTNLLLATLGAYQMGQRLGEFGGCSSIDGCVMSTEGPTTTCSGGICTDDNIMTLYVDTNNDGISDNDMVVNATDYYCTNNYPWCSSKETSGHIMWIIANNLNLGFLFLLGIGTVVVSLILIRITVWIRDWRRNRR